MGRLLLFRGGVSIEDQAIVRFSPRYHHAAWERRDGKVWEATAKGVILSDSYRTEHAAPVVIDPFDAHLTGKQEDDVEARLESHKGEPYDYPGIAGIPLLHPEWQQDSCWFCSEYIGDALRWAGALPFVRCETWQLWPCHLAWPVKWTMGPQIVL